MTDGRRAGLALGTPVRSRRAELKRRLGAGELDLPALLEGDLEQEEEIALGMRIGDLINALPGLGHGGALRVAIAARLLTLDVRLCELTTQRRRDLAGAIRKET